MRRLRNTLALVFGTLTLGGAFAWLVIRPWWRGWGVDPRDVDRPLPGDEVLEGEALTDTRSITIAAPAAAVWPWLVQMGYGRAGWYSYDAVDMRGRSADRLLPGYDLAPGDVVPTHPDGGFVVRVCDPGRALVLYVDAALVAAQAEEARARREAGEAAETTPANLLAAGTFLERTQPPDYAASWAFVLEDQGDGTSRLIERVRTRLVDAGPRTRAAGPLLGFGVFLMVRRQLLGIRDRVQGAARG